MRSRRYLRLEEPVVRAVWIVVLAIAVAGVVVAVVTALS